PEVSDCVLQDRWLIKFTYFLQCIAIQRSAIVSSKIRGRSSSRTSYNAQRSRGQQLSRLRSDRKSVELVHTMHSDPEVSNCLVQELLLSKFTYCLQCTAIQRSAIVSSKIGG